MFDRYKEILDLCWAAHAHSGLHRAHYYMIGAGCPIASLPAMRSWFHDPREVAFFRDTMRVIRNQGDGDPITYEGLCALFRKHINLAKEP